MQVAKYRPGIPIIALACNTTDAIFNEGLVNQLDSLSHGVHGWTCSTREEKGGTVNIEQKDGQGDKSNKHNAVLTLSATIAISAIILKHLQ